jgi:hypothetical protein
VTRAWWAIDGRIERAAPLDEAASGNDVLNKDYVVDGPLNYFAMHHIIDNWIT